MQAERYAPIFVTFRELTAVFAPLHLVRGRMSTGCMTSGSRVRYGTDTAPNEGDRLHC